MNDQRIQKKWSGFLTCLLLTAFVVTGCSFTTDLDEIISTSVDSSRSKIVVPDPAQGIADGESQLPIRVYAMNDEGSPVKNYTPKLGVYGAGEHTVTCEPMGSEYAECKLTASQGGEKLIYAKNAIILEPGRAFFAENSATGSMVVKKSNVPANGAAKALIEVTLSTTSGRGRSGIRPELFVESPQSLNIQCSVTSANGVSQCQLSSKEAGVFKVQSKSPALLPVEVEFVAGKIKVLEGRAFAGVADSKAQVEITASSLPTIVLNPSANGTSSCSAKPAGKYLCNITSSVQGTRILSVSSPAGIDETVELHFASEKNEADVAPGQSPKADGSSEVVVDVVLKDASGNPLVGVIPVAEVEGSGQNSVRCEASNSEGKAKCYVTSTEPGEKKVTIKDPLVKDVVSIDFSTSPVVKELDRVPADGQSPAIIEIATGKEGVIPELSIQGPSSDKVQYVCTPSVKAPGESEAKSTCYISASEAGSYTVSVKTPIQAEIPLTFTDAKSSMSLAANDDGQAKADNTDKVVIKLKVKNSLGMPKIGSTPSLQVNPSGAVQVSCTAVNMMAESTCELKSSLAGTFLVTSTNPVLSEEITVVFTTPFGGLAAENPGLGIVNEQVAVTDPDSKSVIYIELKDASGNPITGSVPVLSIEGSGINSYVCYPSDANGLAKCEIVATEAGEKIVHVVSPPIDQTITLNFQSNVRSCVAGFAATTQQTWVGPGLNDWGVCTILTCETNYTLGSNICSPNVRSCTPMPTGGKVGTQTWDSRDTDKTWGYCTLTECLPNYTLTPSVAEVNNSCVADTRACPAQDLLANFYAGTQTWNGQDWGVCKATICNYPYKVNNFVCATSDNEPTLTGIMVDKVNAIPDEVVASSVLLVSGLDRNVPVTLTGGINSYIERRRSPGTWENLGQGVASGALIDAQAGLKNGDEVRIVSQASSALTTKTTMTLIIGSAPALEWNITTTSALPPSNPVLAHSANMKSFTVAWGSGGLGNGGAGQCQLQYFKNPSWENLNTPYNCDAAQAATTVTLPGDGWINSFIGEGVPVRLVRLTDNSTVLTFTNKLTCAVDAVMPHVNNPLKDENCDGQWANEDDNQAPVNGSFTLASTDGGSSSVTGSTNIILNIECPTDQAGGVQVAFDNAASPTNWSDCVSTKFHTLVAGTGNKTVYARFKDAYGNTTADLTQSIALDQSAPTGGALAINAGAARTNLTGVTLNITCPSDSNAPIEMAYGTSASSSDWEPCVASKSFALPTGDGSKTVYARFRDKFGNASSDVSDSIILDQTGAVSTLSYTNGWVNSLSLALTASASDAQSSTPLVCSIEAQEAFLSGSTPGAYGSFVEVSNSCTSTSYSLQSGKAYKLRMKATDSLGNVGAYVTPALEVKVDNVAPSISSVTATTTGNQPACNTVRVTVAGASDSGSGLQSSAYSFDNGSSWQASATKDFATTSLSLGSNQIQVRDVAGNIFSYASAVSGSSEACSCTLPWGGTTASGSQVTAYLDSAPMHPTTCSSQQRTCTNGSLSGSYTYQSCVQQYTYSWQSYAWGSCSASPYWGSWGSCSASCNGGTQYRSCENTSGTQTRTNWCRRSDGQSVSNSFCTGTQPATSQSCSASCSGSSSQSCNTQACCTWGYRTQCTSTYTCCTSASYGSCITNIDGVTLCYNGQVQCSTCGTCSSVYGCY